MTIQRVTPATAPVLHQQFSYTSTGVTSISESTHIRCSPQKWSRPVSFCCAISVNHWQGSPR